jgi:prevent-host-death family protein
LSRQTISHTDARNQLAGLIESAFRDREPITITRNGEGKVVLLAIEEYEAMETTRHLHSTRANVFQIQHLKGWWSRRSTQEHRLVYRVEGDSIIMQCRFHHDD